MTPIASIREPLLPKNPAIRYPYGTTTWNECPFGDPTVMTLPRDVVNLR